MTVEMPKKGDLVEFTVRASVSGTSADGEGFYFSNFGYVELEDITSLKVVKKLPTKLGSVVYVNGTGYVLVESLAGRSAWRSLTNGPGSAWAGWYSPGDMSALNWTTGEDS